jgi:hypothetical protein
LINNAALRLLFTLVAITAAAQPMPAFVPRRPVSLPGTPGLSASTPELTNAPPNYLVRVEWKDTNGPVGVIEVLTAEGQFQASSSFPGSGSVAGEPAPSTPVSLNGTLKALNAEQGHFQLFLGRTVSENVGGPGQKLPSIQQRQEGLTVTFFVTFGKPVVAQKDVNGEVSVLVKKQTP